MRMKNYKPDTVNAFRRRDNSQGRGRRPNFADFD